MDNKEKILVEKPLEITESDFTPVPGNLFTEIEDEVFNSHQSYKRAMKDYKFFKRFQRYNHVTHYVHNKEPHNHVYEKMFWKFTCFDKFCYLLRNHTTPFSSSPFSPEGECSFFEFETLYSPQRCIAYSFRTRELSKINLRRFSKALKVSISDIYEDILIDGLDHDDSGFHLTRFLVSEGAVKFLNTQPKKDEIPTTIIDRKSWPSYYIDRENINTKYLKLDF